MSEKTINSRIVHKHDIEAHWKLATNFYPKQGEIIVYDVDNTYNYERFKIGDGKTLVSALPFTDDALREVLIAKINDVDNKVDAVSGLVGDISVSDQINIAIDNTTANDFGIYVQDVEPVNAIVGDVWIDTVHNPSYIVPTIPPITDADNGKVLMVVNGTLQLVNLNLSIDANGVVSM